MTEIGANTQVCLVIGDPISHSISPEMHNAAYAATGLAGRFVYIAARVAPGELESALRGVRALGFRGVSVTVPHKRSVLALVDEVEPLAEKIGAVNTIVNENGRLKGYNTDGAGVVDPLRKRLSLKQRRILILGAGGAARAAAFALQAEGALITVTNRTAASGLALAREVGGVFQELERVQMPEFEAVLNCTTVGMHPQVTESPLLGSTFFPGQIVFDLVYNPYETLLLRRARADGAEVIPGAEMFVAQGAKQFKLYTGWDPPVAEMERILRQRLGV